MKVELVNFYRVKNKNKRHFGTCHVCLPELGIELRGIDVMKHNKNVFVKLPHRQGYDTLLKKKVVYPVVHFSDSTQHTNLLKSIKNLLDVYFKEDSTC